MIKTIAVILDGLSLPATQGGAVENLVQFILDANERDPQFKFLVFTHGNAGAQELAKRYLHSAFFFFPREGRVRKFKAILRSLINRISSRYFGNQFISEVLGRSELASVDAILLENSPQFSIVLKRKYPNIPIVSHLHNRYLFKGCRFGRAILDSVDWHLGVSLYICQEIASLAGRDLPNVRCLYNGIDTERFTINISDDERAELRKKLGIGASDFVFLFSGRVVPHKGIFELLEAFSILRKESGIKNLKLLVLGAFGFSGTEAQCPCPDGVVFSGFIDYPEIHKYYALGDVAVLPSLVDEAFGLTCAEALCSGLPVIISDAGGLPEVADERSAIIVCRGEGFAGRLAEAMLLLARNEEQRKKTANAARERGIFFSKEKYWDDFVKFFQTL